MHLGNIMTYRCGLNTSVVSPAKHHNRVFCFRAGIPSAGKEGRLPRVVPVGQFRTLLVGGRLSPTPGNAPVSAQFSDNLRLMDGFLDLSVNSFTLSADE